MKNFRADPLQRDPFHLCWQANLSMTILIHLSESDDFHVPNHQGFYAVWTVPKTTQKHSILMIYNWKFPLGLGLGYGFVLAFLRQIDFIEGDFERWPQGMSNFNIWLKTESVLVDEMGQRYCDELWQICRYQHLYPSKLSAADNQAGLYQLTSWLFTHYYYLLFLLFPSSRMPLILSCQRWNLRSCTDE